VNKVAAICYYHIRRFRQIRRQVGSGVTIRLALALIMFRIDYCNSAVDDRTTAASTERSSSPGVRTRTEGECYSKPSSATLATSLLSGPVQAMLLNELDRSWQLCGVGYPKNRLPSDLLLQRCTREFNTPPSESNCVFTSLLLTLSVYTVSEVKVLWSFVCMSFYLLISLLITTLAPIRP